MDHYTTPQEAQDEGDKKAKSALASGWQTKAAPLAAVQKHFAAFQQFGRRTVEEAWQAGYYLNQASR